MATKNKTASISEATAADATTREASVITAMYLPLSLLARVNRLVAQRNAARVLPPSFIKQRDDLAKSFGEEKADKWLAGQERAMYGARKVSRNAILLEALRSGLDGLVTNKAAARKAAAK